MNIVAVIKQTPDTETVIRIAPNGSQIVTSDIKWIINPYDEFAIEAALRLREKHGGTVTVLSYGPQRVVEALRTALAMGADDAVLIDDADMKRADFLQVTEALAAAAREKKAIPWVRVYRIPTYVYFSHRVHTKAGATCETCHGPVRERDVITKEISHNMRSCMACHAATKARNDCATCHEER